jgi:hypothetical protein
MAAMIVHAAGESAGGLVPDGTHAIVLMVPGEPALQRELQRLQMRGCALVAVYEDQAPYAGQLMALGLRPGRKEDLRRHCSSLPMLK